jgi:hypothetical protein
MNSPIQGGGIMVKNQLNLGDKAVVKKYGDLPIYLVRVYSYTKAERKDRTGSIQQMVNSDKKINR